MCLANGSNGSNIGSGPHHGLSKCKKENSKMIMDSVCKIYGDQDLIYGYRMGITRSPELQEAMCQLQQRRYV